MKRHPIALAFVRAAAFGGAFVLLGCALVLYGCR